MTQYIKICKVDNCSDKAIGRGFCWKHYQRWRRYRDTSDPVFNTDKVCSVEGCNNKVKSNDLCAMHYARMLSNGDVHTVKRHKCYGDDEICVVPGCGLKPKGKGMCNKHVTNFYYHKRKNHLHDVESYIAYLEGASQQEKPAVDTITAPVEVDISSEEHARVETVSKDVYKCFLNGQFYGAGPGKYMAELFKDYVETMEMYGRDECSFTIQRFENPIELQGDL